MTSSWPRSARLVSESLTHLDELPKTGPDTAAQGRNERRKENLGGVSRPHPALSGLVRPCPFKFSQMLIRLETLNGWPSDVEIRDTLRSEPSPRLGNSCRTKKNVGGE